MNHISELKPAATRPRPNTRVQPRLNGRVMTNATPRNSQPVRRNEPSGFPRPQARNAQNAQRNYERYLALARAEALTGDRIVAANYFQNAQHFSRSIGETGEPAASGQKSLI